MGGQRHAVGEGGGGWWVEEGRRLIWIIEWGAREITTFDTCWKRKRQLCYSRRRRWASRTVSRSRHNVCTPSSMWIPCCKTTRKQYRRQNVYLQPKLDQVHFAFVIVRDQSWASNETFASIWTEFDMVIISRHKHVIHISRIMMYVHIRKFESIIWGPLSSLHYYYCPRPSWWRRLKYAFPTILYGILGNSPSVLKLGPAVGALDASTALQKDRENGYEQKTPWRRRHFEFYHTPCTAAANAIAPRKDAL